MQPILFLIFIALTLLIAYQDFTERAVLWILFPALAAIGIISHFPKGHYYFLNTGINCLFIIIQISILWVYFFCKTHSVSAIKENIGLGDILFFFASACFFPVEQYLLYNVLCFGCIIVTVLIYRQIKKLKTIPLAGVQSLFLLLVKLIGYAGENN